MSNFQLRALLETMLFCALLFVCQPCGSRPNTSSESNAQSGSAGRYKTAGNRDAEPKCPSRNAANGAPSGPARDPTAAGAGASGKSHCGSADTKSANAR